MIAKTVATHAAERETRFVFPTQVSADSWAEAALHVPGTMAIEMDRFLGWDTFLDRITSESIPEGKKKSDARSRLLWALATLSEQSIKPFLKYLSKPGIAPSLSLARDLAKLAPSLRSIALELRSHPPAQTRKSGDEEIADYVALAERYSRFLEKHLLFEPCDLDPARAKTDHFIIFEPALMPGFNKLEERLRNNFSMEIFQDIGKSADQGATGPTLLKFSTFREELQTVFAACASLLDEGCQPSDIAISIPVPTPEMQAHVKFLARQCALPIGFRFGEPLAASPFGRLLNSLSNALSEGFSMRTLARLFDRGAFRWKDEAAARKLLRYGVRYNIPEFSADKHYMSGLWSRTFSSCPDPGVDVYDFYSSIKKTALSIAGASSFESLQRALYNFKESFLEKSDVNSLADRTLARILEELEALEQWHSRLGAPDLAASPFDILLLALDSTPYKPVEKDNAISIYPYHLGMLIACPIHFVLDASQQSLMPALGYFSRIPEEVKIYLEEEVDISETLLSSFDAVNAVYCHAEHGLSGYSVPHPYFSRMSAIQKKIGSEQIPNLSDELEAHAWRNATAESLPDFLPVGRKHAATGFFASKAPQPDFYPPPALCDIKCPSSIPLDPSFLMKLPACNAAPLFKLSPARLKNISQCPFKWFSTCIPSLDPGPPAVVDLAEGSLTHALISALLQKIAARDGGFNPTRIEEYMDMLDSSLKHSLASILRQDGPSVQPALEAAFPKIRDRIARLLDFEKDFKTDGWEIGAFEVTLSRIYEELGLQLEGRADRIASRSTDAIDSNTPVESYAVIDYKKKNTPKKKDFLIDDGGNLGDFQIASYATMLEGENKNIGMALYWSIEESKAINVFGPNGARHSWEEFEPERKALASALTKASRTIRGGSFLNITPSTEACAKCPIRPICRAHFSSERL